MLGVKRKNSFYKTLQPYQDISSFKGQSGYKDIIELREGFRLEDPDTKMQISCYNYIFMSVDIVIFLLVVIGMAGLSKHSEILKTLP